MLTEQRPYIFDLHQIRRRPTRVVMVGDVGVGGDNPIRVQSMTTTLTKDIPATVDQTERLVKAGCEIVRITTPTPADARCLGPIKQQLAERGIRVPIVADIHFSPAAAMAAADFADKVRVNPGNFVDSRKFAVREYSDEQYEAELRRVEERFLPLVLKCRGRGVAMRIGTNHGSLSDRIMNRFGDTPEGMVESALEFVHVCERQDYRDIILSMKASNPKVMIAAYRLLAARMAQLNMDYPFHLGVTEAGNAEDGRIKSAIGIGSLLEDGVGDTIRVSLTEEPEAEIPVAFAIAGRYPPARPVAGMFSHRGPETSVTPPENDAMPASGQRSSPRSPHRSGASPFDPIHYERRHSSPVSLGHLQLGGAEQVAVITSIDEPLSSVSDAMAHILRWASPAGRRVPKPDAAVLRIESHDDLTELRRVTERLRRWPQARLSLMVSGHDSLTLREALPLADGVVWEVSAGNSDVIRAARAAGKALVLQATPRNTPEIDIAVTRLLDAAEEAVMVGIRPLLTIEARARDRIAAYRDLATESAERGLDLPIILRADDTNDRLLAISISLGSLLCDGLGDAVLLGGSDSASLAFNVLQAAGTRVSKTDYVACPSCGRTLFDLQETTERIKQRTAHLVGVKLAIMGCIVNGPGEMADADFGYVGGAPGQVNLYVGKECVEKGVPAEVADDRLVDLIKAHGKWQEEVDE